MLADWSHLPLARIAGQDHLASLRIKLNKLAKIGTIENERWHRAQPTSSTNIEYE